MSKLDYKDYWVYLETSSQTVLPVSLELCSEVRKLCNDSGEKLVAVYTGKIDDMSMKKVLDSGVDKIIHVSGTGYDTFSVDGYTHLFTELCKKYKPSAVFVGGTINGRDFAPRFACRLETGCTSDATELVYNKDSGDIEFIEPAVGGKIMAVITVPELRPQVGTIRPGTFKYAPEGAKENVDTVEVQIDFDESNNRTKVIDFKSDNVDEALMISDAEYIVCVGNAIKVDALDRYRKLADLLGGKIACTRPVYDRGLLPYQIVIGQSGVAVKPKIYLAFGVSGAANHVTGIKDSDTIIAVNKDPDAPIFNYCNYGIVGDMDEVCDALIQKLENM